MVQFLQNVQQSRQGLFVLEMTKKHRADKAYICQNTNLIGMLTYENFTVQ